MEPGSKYNLIIVRYLLNEADSEEEKFVLNWMNAGEENRLYVENLRKTLQLIDLTRKKEEMDIEKEWGQLQERLAGTRNTEVQLAPVTIPAVEIVNERPRRTTRIYRILSSSVAAAALLIFIFFGWKPFRTSGDAGHATARPEMAVKEKIDSMMAVVHHEVNTSGHVIRFGLPDGSQIALANNSEITYKEPVNGHRRDVYLNGKADFSVARDKSKPFTVYSGDISTTAIGTRFTVTAADNESYIWVKLNEGRIVVKPVNGHNNKWLKDFYLTPGQELVYDSRQKTAKLRVGPPAQHRDIADKTAAKDNPAVPHYNNRSWFMFNNQSLPEVLDALADMYHVKIVYAKDGMKDKYFIGTFDRTEPLEKILNQLAMLNSLDITNAKDTFFVKAQPLSQKR